MVARLKPNVALEQANAELQRLVKLIVADYPAKIKQALDRMPNFSLESRAVPFREEFAGDVRRPLLLLMAAVGVVLLIGCADVANLMFSRMVGRRREFALRSALGAGRWRLARQALAEGLVLAVGGGMIGFFLAAWTLPLLVHFAPENLPRITEVGFNWRVTAFVVIVTLATPLLFCLAPLAGAVRASLAERFRGEGRTTTVGRNQRLVMSGAVVLQFSLAFLLLTAAGLLSKSLIRAIESDPGFRPQRLVSTRIALPDAAYKTSDEITTFFNRLFERINALPGVRQTGAISDLPMRSTSNVVISIEGRGIETERVDMVFCRGNALDALGVGLLRGRLLQPEDQLGKLPAVVISEGLAKRISPNGNPLGRRIRFGVDVPNNNERWLTVVGVVADVKATLTSNAPRLLLFTTPADWVKQMDLLVQTADNPLALANAIRHEIALLDPNLSFGKVETLDDVLDQSLSAERFRTWLLACFAIAALLLTTLGIAGLLAHNVAKRTQEFGVRMALGADRRALMTLVFRHSLRLSLTGIVVGLAVSLIAVRLISALLYETSPFDLATFLAVAAILVAVALAAAFLPAWRVSHTSPLAALRSE
jgi:predicted permease